MLDRTGHRPGQHPGAWMGTAVRALRRDRRRLILQGLCGGVKPGRSVTPNGGDSVTTVMKCANCCCARWSRTAMLISSPGPEMTILRTGRGATPPRACAINAAPIDTGGARDVAQRSLKSTSAGSGCSHEICDSKASLRMLSPRAVSSCGRLRNRICARTQSFCATREAALPSAPRRTWQRLPKGSRPGEHRSRRHLPS